MQSSLLTGDNPFYTKKPLKPFNEAAFDPIALKKVMDEIIPTFMRQQGTITDKIDVDKDKALLKKLKDKLSDALGYELPDHIMVQCLVKDGSVVSNNGDALSQYNQVGALDRPASEFTDIKSA